jgi:two-component system, response regulator PdtaR
MANLKILIVEDDTSWSDLYARMLKRLGHHVVASVTTGETALQIAPHLNPDIILTDVHLAGHIDGIAVANAVNSRLKIPVIVTSGQLFENLLDSDASMSQHQFLGKPFSSEQLADAISRAHDSESPR